MWYNTTRDFQTFSEPRVWQDPFPLSRIDTTAIKVGDEYYRVTKNEAGNAGSDIFSEKNTDFLDSDINAWELVAPALGRTTWQANAGYEGPVIFKANPGDTSCPGEFYLWGDRYTNGGGYQAACEADIEAQTWRAETITMTNAGVPRPRHGTVLPITLREWNSIRGIANEDVATTVDVAVEDFRAGDTGQVTATVAAADGFETGGMVRFTAGDWTETAYLEDGKASATIPAGLADGEHSVTAEFLGFGILLASDTTASFTVLPAVSASVSVTDRCVAGKVVLVVTVANDDERKVELRIDTPYGVKPVGALVSGKSHAAVFTTRTATVPAGSLTVTVAAGTGDDREESVYTVDHGSMSCTP
jgi:hypothetical protein